MKTSLTQMMFKGVFLVIKHNTLPLPMIE